MLSKKLPEPGTTKIFRLNSTINKPIVSNILVLPTTEGTHYIPHENIIRLEADSNYTVIYTTETKITCSRTLKRLEEDLPNGRFVRIHASHIINVEHLGLRSKTFVRMSNGDEVRVSRSKSKF
ncbi:MAG TPA: LytTR family DNA-binding domain-containing protein [Saprospiraceae bacterium]|nr:LytTR family DNA-binding domain-containing protein [Saprospiraceae bacterium]